MGIYQKRVDQPIYAHRKYSIWRPSEVKKKNHLYLAITQWISLPALDEALCGYKRQ